MARSSYKWYVLVCGMIDRIHIVLQCFEFMTRVSRFPFMVGIDGENMFDPTFHTKGTSDGYRTHAKI